MQVTGVQAVGARGYVALAPVVVETQPSPTSTAREASPAVQAARALEAEAVVFPRRGASVDRRPAELKHARAIARYLENTRVVAVRR